MPGRGSTPLVPIVLAAATVCGSAQSGWAKHKTTPAPAGGDPCAAPTAYVSDHIRQIKAIEAQTPTSSSSLFDMLDGHKDFEAQKAVQISQLRYDADGVNALLEAGGCKSFDIDRELAPAAK